MIRVLLALALLALALLALPARAADPAKTEEIVSGVSQSGVSITTNFDGTAILVYGAAIRDAPPPEWPLLQVIITVAGPDTKLVIRKKEHIAGIWLNRGAVKITAAPSFYAVATTGDIGDILTPAEDAKYHVTIPRTIEADGPATEAQGQYVAALQRIRMESGAYRLAQDSVLLLRQALFRTDIILPANLVEGTYIVRIFLTRGGQVVDMQENRIDVQKTGLERTLYKLAMEQPLIYGLLSLALAMVAGWSASELFKRMRF